MLALEINICPEGNAYPQGSVRPKGNASLDEGIGPDKEDYLELQVSCRREVSWELALIVCALQVHVLRMIVLSKRNIGKHFLKHPRMTKQLLLDSLLQEIDLLIRICK